MASLDSVVAVAKSMLCSIRSLLLLGVCWEDPPHDELLSPVNGQLPVDLFARGRPKIRLVLQPLSSPSVASSWRFRVLLLRFVPFFGFPLRRKCLAFGTDGSPVGHICLRTAAGLMVSTLLWRVKCGSSSWLISMVFS
ncbi:hypothetical protein ISN44_As10g014410 [Arabidopsis suecica]|uniref:Uncharacterized protein n=1 Tax=Arabidopsis suecica TaxID=45249 RepID=A0A8T1ZV20_ARASU|nr:hypothetical protein ISN44_As10g014410 [Arabidopsis suecica]